MSADYVFRATFQFWVPNMRTAREAREEMKTAIETAIGNYLVGGPARRYVRIMSAGRVTFVSKTDRVPRKYRSPYIDWRTFVRDHAAAKKEG